MSVMLVLSGRPYPAGEQERAVPDSDPDFRRIVQQAKARVFPAVIYIRCVRESLEGGRRERQEVSGSGVIISPQGEALTNWHVTDKATDIRCLLSDGRHFNARTVGSDKDVDLALVQLVLPPGEHVPWAPLGDSTLLQEGDFVMAMGAPWGLNRSVSIGIVSCASRFLEQVSEYSLWIQTDAAINPGNSGGPLVNTSGEVVGLNARGAAGLAEGLGFAIPAETIRMLLPRLRADGAVNWSWLGVRLQPLRDFERDMYFDADEGVIVAETDPDSPARGAGLRPLDRIVRVNGESVTARVAEDLPAVRRRLALLPRGQEAVFEVVRGSETLTVTLVPREKGRVEGEELALERWDFTVKTINQFANPDLFFHRQRGVFVFGVRHPGNAANAGLARGDILLTIDGREVTTLDDVRTIHAEMLSALATRSRVRIDVLRRGLLRQVVLDFSRDYSRQ